MTASPPPLRITLIIRSLGVGGAERQLAVLAMGLAERGHVVQVIPYYDGGVWGADLQAAGVVVAPLGKRSRWDIVAPGLRLRRTIRAFEPDIIHGYLPDGNLASLIAGKVFHRAKVVWGVRASDYDFRIYDGLFYFLFRISAWMARGADLVIVNAVAGRDYHVARGYPGSRCIVIPNGIDTVRFRRDQDRRNQQRRAWGIRDGQAVIGIIGRLDPMKDHATFLKAVALTASQLPEARFVVVGDGPGAYRAHLEALATEHGIADRLTWVPIAKDLVAVYNALDLLVSASATGEGFPNVIGEAMACGVLCVVTNAGDSALVVGDAGIVVPRGDAAALAEGWRRGLRWLEDPARPDPRHRIAGLFDAQRMVNLTERTLIGLLHGAGGRSADGD